MRHPHIDWMEQVIFEAISGADLDAVVREKLGVEEFTSDEGVHIGVEHMDYLGNIRAYRHQDGILVVFKDGSEFTVKVEAMRAPYRDV